jgi:hypothetical protein
VGGGGEGEGKEKTVPKKKKSNFSSSMKWSAYKCFLSPLKFFFFKKYLFWLLFDLKVPQMFFLAAPSSISNLSLAQSTLVSMSMV